MVFRDLVEGDGPAAVDARGELLTHLYRHDELFHAGYRFEAVAARALLAEAVLLAYIGIRRQVDGLKVSENAERKLTSGRVTFGQLKDILIESAGFSDQQLKVDVEEYVRLRNVLTHRLLAHFGQVELSEMHELGRSVVAGLWSYVRKRLPPEPSPPAA